MHPLEFASHRAIGEGRGLDLDSLIDLFPLACTFVAFEDEVRYETFGVTLDGTSLELDLQRQTQLIILGQSFVDCLKLAREVGEVNSPFFRASLSCLIIAGWIITEKVILLRLPEIWSPKIIPLCGRGIPSRPCKERLRHLKTSVNPTLRCF